MSLLRLPFIRSHFSLLLLCISVLIIGTHCDCGFPPRFTEAELRPEYDNNKNYTENSTVGYNCRPGYIRIPGSNNNITCLGNSSWSTPDEFCSKRSCPSLSEIENGYFQVKDFLFGSIATYFCNEGYRMESNRPFRECKADGTWSNADPVCAVVICAKPDSIPNGTYTPEKDEYNYQDAVTYSCNKDLVLTGRSTISCGSNGTWSTEVPKCIVVSCSNPNVLNSERLSGFVGPYTLNSGVSFKCKDGFVMNGSSSSVCNIDSQWEPPLPECLAITCPEPEVPNSERVTGVSGPYIVNSQVSFKCKSNFTMKGSNSSTCGITGQWAPPLPECLIVSCPEPEVPNSERVTGISGPYIVNSQVSFKCKSGFTIKGSNSSTCGNDGHWEPRLPECLTITCPEPEVPNSERVTGVSGPYIVNSQVSFKCKINFTIKGSNSSTCGNDGQWAPPLPECLNSSGTTRPLVTGILFALFIIAITVFA
ncbi:complement receptor type 1 isoform X3 [Bombina bombina]|uniref:complement receptor type 1 isoform X3 n=1 Tax=Bombina bombina TaxID=8345 RepID=UPI00235ADBF8|nr:complement receptor type 1 isoform X3 [Bombina bombina]